MQASKQQSWKINITAKSNNFHFKFKATNTNPTCKLSLVLKLQEFLFRVKTDSQISIPTPKKQPTSLRSKFLKIVSKLKRSPAKKQAITARNVPILQYPQSKFHSNPLKWSTDEKPNFFRSLFIVMLALLSKSISEKSQKGMMIHGLSILLVVALFSKKHETTKARCLMVFLTFALVVFCAVMVPLDKYIYFGTKDYVLQFVWKAWNYFATSGSVYVLFQVIFSRFCDFCQFVGANFLTSQLDGNRIRFG